MRRPGSKIPLSLAALADLSLVEGQREAAFELINQAYAAADAIEQRGAKCELGRLAPVTPRRRTALAAA